MSDRIQAFSLLELIVTLAISSILVVISYLGIQKITQSYRHFNEICAEKEYIEQCLLWFYTDFYSAEKVIKQKNQYALIDGNRTIHYRPLNNAVIRIFEGKIDTIKNINIQFNPKSLIISFSNGNQVELDFLLSAVPIYHNNGY